MNKARIRSLILFCLVIILGLLSRKISFLPLATGDMLWAIMMFYLVSFLFTNWDLKKKSLLSLIICYIVELSQLYQAEWINFIRGNRLGRLVLGQGFLWSDLLAYTLGIGLIYLIEDKLNHREIKS